VNRNVELDFSNPTLVKLIRGGRWDVPAGSKLSRPTAASSG
jgi:hypothetical protein